MKISFVPAGHHFKSWFDFKNKKARILFSSIVGVLILAVIVIYFYPSSLPKTQTQQNLSSHVYKNVTGTVSLKNNPPASIVIAPATQQWWSNLLGFSSDNTLASLDFSTVSKNAYYVAYTTSSGSQYKSYTSFGMSTSFIIYKDSTAARNAGKILGSKYNHFVRGNMVLFIPLGAYSDVDYALIQYKKAKVFVNKNDLNLKGKAMWQINMSEFSKIFLKNANSHSTLVFNTTMRNLGVTNTSGWVGYSTDGLTWSGKTTGSNISTVKSPKDVVKYLAAQAALVNDNGSLTPLVIKASKKNSNSGGLIELRQALIPSCCMVISNNSETVGSIQLPGMKQPVKGKILPKKTGIFQLTILSNQWLALMKEETTAYPVSHFNKIVFTLINKKGKSTIILSPSAIVSEPAK